MISQRFLIQAAVVVMAIPAASVPVRAQTASGTPLTVAKIKDMLEARVPAARILAAARASCISFRMTAGIEAELRGARAEPVVIEGLRSVCYAAETRKPPVTLATTRRTTPTTTPTRRPTTASLTRGVERTGTLDTADPVFLDGTRYDEWTFSATAGERLEIYVRQIDFDPKVAVVRLMGSELLGSDDDGGAGTDARYMLTAPASGQFVARVMPFSTTLGRYAIRVSTAPPQRAPDTRYATVGQRVEGALDASDATTVDGHPIEDWRFNAQYGQHLTFDLSSSDFDPYLLLGEMRGGEFVQLQYDDDSGEGNSSLLSDWSPPRSGEFAVRVRPFGTTSSGRYSLAITSGSVARTPTPTSGYISARENTECRSLSSTTRQRPDQPVAAFTVTPPSTGMMTLTTENDTPDPVLYIYSPAGSGWSLLASDDDSGEGLRPLVRTQVTAGARHLVCVWSYGDQTGTMVLQTRYDDPVAGGVAPRSGRTLLPRGTAQTGMLASGDSVHSDGSYIDQWEFSGTRGETVYIRLTSNAFRPYFSFFSLDANGRSQFIEGSSSSTSTSTEATITLPHTGTFVVHANSHGAGATGPYVISVQTR